MTEQSLSQPASDDSRADRASVHMLYVVRDELPPFRVDVTILFGVELPRFGITCDLVGQASREVVREDGAWPAGLMWFAGLTRKGIYGEVLRPFRDLATILRRLDKHHQIIQVRDKIRTGLLALCVSRLTGRSFSYWMSFPFAEDFEYRFRATGTDYGVLMWAASAVRAFLAKRILYGVVARYADHIFAQSDAMRDMLVSKGIPPDRITPVPMGVDANALTGVKPIEPRPEQLTGRRVIVYSGKLSRSRNSDFLLSVVHEVRKSVPNVLLLLVGDGDTEVDQRWIRNSIDRAGLSSCVWLTGWMPHDQALAFVACAEVGLSPIPRGELYDVSSPTKVVEYLALSLPCVASDVPDQQLVIERSGGGVCVPMEVPAFSDGVIELLRDPQRAKRQGQEGRKWALGHRSYERLAVPVAAAYWSLIRARNSARLGGGRRG